VLPPLRTSGRWPAALSLAALTVAAPAAARDWHPDVEAAIAYARARDGAVRFSVRADGGVWGLSQLGERHGRRRAPGRASSPR
jgi:hypothetical protein